MTRHESRQEAFCLLFEKTFTNQPIDDIIEGATETRDLQVSEFTLTLAKGTEEHLAELDALIESKLKNWKLSRISKVSLAILRMAAFELQYVADVPMSVTINEAVELAKQYASEDDYAFVNGVLGAIAKEYHLENKTGKE
ncbi:transcription antitermination factor NusB [uncultured Negativibacillus sp.]|uniref:transcription antitermination factor NusB n=1 Tax=uncultured Negativibacillus sp. TaxID=1980696 RepID=UPI0025CE2C76|nr:transcription antitermination factor NusB [uncultured Negativibacillus sp.]